MEQAKAQLGRYLFYDTRLSGNGSYACASCHQQERAFTDGRKHAIGATGEEHTKNTPTLTNVGYASSLTWSNPHLTSLEDQARRPMFGSGPIELGLSDNANAVLSCLQADPLYRTLFGEAFPTKAEPISFGSILSALASFERTLISFNSPFDRFVYQGDENALSPSAKSGMRLFFSTRLGCSECHSGWNFAEGTRSLEEPDVAPAFYNTGVPRDPNEPNSRAFKVATLRNIAVTAHTCTTADFPHLPK